jgi:hypothetical protein
MATTTNYSWSTPDNTAYVKDGASAIRTLGSSVDTTLWGLSNGKNVALSSVLSTTFAATTTVTADGVFTSTFKNYRIVFNCTSSSGAAGEIQMRFRASGVANSSALYNLGSKSRTYAGADDNANQASTTYAFAMRINGGPFTGVIDLMQPQQAQGTFFTINNADSAQAGVRGGFHNSSSVFDGIQFINSAAANMTGTIQIFGYRD